MLMNSDLVYTSRQCMDSRFEQLCSSRTSKHRSVATYGIVLITHTVALNRRRGQRMNGAHEQ